MLEPPTFTYLNKFGHSAHTFSNKAALYIFLHALRYHHNTLEVPPAPHTCRHQYVLTLDSRHIVQYN
ncbi:hypothetical protein M405DRAFT_868406 [Rhizopogon salebrosus TDB-379]|nr:hypothetical protein M405DRAFT_868406 [Rhizopogon salebrosus TDB-379]